MNSEQQSMRPYFLSLLDDLTTRGARAAQGLLSLGNEPLRAHLHREWTKSAGENGALLGDPVFEPTFGWEEADTTMRKLSGKLLHPKLVEVMSKPPKALADEYAFPLDRHPFRHQLESWQLLGDEAPRSLVITSGTGSGKTECFLVPILNDLARAVDAEGRLQGVRALFIYPLNALINSQQSRLDAWTHAFDGRIRHCLYTGALENKAPAKQREYAGQVIDRTELRASAPPMLVTNATMLEFMLVRRDDAPILEQSAGKLRWIVLDEAHSYVGSQAAEMALLLRRVMIAFKVRPADVRFIATSATFGGDEKTRTSLRDFLANMAGVDAAQVHVVSGRRAVSELPAVAATRPFKSLEEISAIDAAVEDSQERFDALVRHAVARRLREEFTREKASAARTLSDIVKALDGPSLRETLRWLDVASGTRVPGGQHFLPLRAHLFHNVIPTLKVCVDARCGKRNGTLLDDSRWSYGMVYAGEQTRCDCGAPVLPLVSCNECNEVFLLGAMVSGGLRDPSQEDEDEFVLEDPDAEDVEDEESVGASTDLLVTNRPFQVMQDQIAVDCRSLKVTGDDKLPGSVSLTVFYQSGSHECPGCGTSSAAERLLRFSRIGTPFTLSTVISTLLEYCPPDRSPAGKPFDGRKMISFTDSRQGTARIAVKLQQDSERSRIRGLVYQRLMQTPAEVRLSDEDETLLAELSQEQADGRINERDQRLLGKLLDQKGASPSSVPWAEMVSWLAGTPEVQHGLMDYYYQLAPFAFDSNTSHRALSGMLLAREFYRRPKRANSLETLGLVKVVYPGLLRVDAVPRDWSGDLATWRGYLKTLLDFYVRENSFIRLDDNWLALIGSRIRTKWLLPPTVDQTNTSRIKRWPQVRAGGNRSRSVLLLAKAFELDISTDRDRIDSWLRCAWTDLVEKAKVLMPFGGQFQLDLEQLGFELARDSFICPVTRRFVDMAFKGLSPYTPQGNRGMLFQAEPASIPVPRLPISEGSSAVVEYAREWCNTDSQVRDLRERGLWSDIHDRVIEGGGYYRAAEHSAQQPKKRLQKYENLFKQGKINLLSCSTTMEMGVDIGGITVVAMNNVPPHPANYLQRAGRAGRRREGRSLAVTVCKNTPHDQHVFAETRWAFDTALRLPQVSLQSAPLVQRHVNSYLLSFWIKRVTGGAELKSLKCGEFFVSAGHLSLADRFARWCSDTAEELPGPLQDDLRDILMHTALAGLEPGAPVRQAGLLLGEATRHWAIDHEALRDQQSAIGSTDSPAAKAVKIQLDRLEGEYLLKELATRRFLPGYGFPTDIVSFDTLSRANIGQARAEAGREDNRGRYRELASRDRVTGLREYAPGAEIVMDGLVYRSAGITLNWRVPASEKDVKEAQLFKSAWRCAACGACSSRVARELDVHCDVCGSAIDRDQIKDYLVPSGFAVDFLEDKPHTDITSPRYVPVKRPWLGIRDGSWMRLANPLLGQQRTSRNAQLFHHTAGEHGGGFAVCLECGRAEPMLAMADTNAAANEQYLPPVFRAGQEHRRLRGGRDEAGGAVCAGSHNAWKIKAGVCLGHDATTDALELMLFDPATGAWLRDGTAAYSIAVALRNAIAAEIGVQAEELGCDCSQVRHDGHEASVIQVFDLRSGGYSSQAAAFINEPSLWRKVIKSLLCNCARACQRCLLAFDTRFEVDRLDRNAALQWVNNRWLAQLQLPLERQVMGTGTIAESASMREAVERELQKGLYDEVRVYLNGDASRWDLGGAHYLRSRVSGWRSEGYGVRICLPVGAVARLDEEGLCRLLAFAANDVVVEEVGLTPFLSGFVPVISLTSSESAMTWAIDDIEAASPGRYWCAPSHAAQVVRATVRMEGPARAVEQSVLRAGLSLAAEYSLRNELDGALKDFGVRFWSWLSDKNESVRAVLGGDEVLLKATYSDRYVRNPLSCAVLTSVLHELYCRASTDESTRINVYGQTFTKEPPRYPPSQVHHDWLNDVERDAGLSAALSYCGVPYVVKSHQARPHSRYLELEFASGRKLRMRLDQGFSFWDLPRDQSLGRRTAHDFRADPSRQGEAIARLAVPVAGFENADTQVFVTT